MLLTFTRAEAQETYATLTISNKSFPDASDGGSLIGSNVKIDGMSVYINEKYFCNFSGNQLTSPGNLVKSLNIDISNPELTVKLFVFYVHHEWNLGGTIHYLNLSKEFIVNNLILNTQGVSATNTFNSFNDLDETISVNWSLDYKVEISPFKPKINKIDERKCFNLPFWVSMDPNSPELYNNSGSVYDWEYGLVTDDLIYNQEFSMYIQNVASDLSYQCQLLGGIDTYNIYNAVINSSYDFMIDYLYMYEDVPANKGNIAGALFYGLMYQVGYYLSEAEINFLNDYFESAVLARPDCIAPFKHDISVKNWIPLESGKRSTDLIEFIPAIRLSELTDKAKISFRVRAINPLTSKTSPWSDGPWFDILPSPPIAGSIKADSSCIYKTTGKIKISDIKGPVNTSLFAYRIVDANSSCGDFVNNTIDIDGYSVNVEAASGSFKLCLTYSNETIKGCVSEQQITVPSLPKLDYRVFTKDVSCPGGSDGSIRIKILDGAGNFTSSVDDFVTNKSDNDFTGLPAKLYDVKVSDFCSIEGPVAYKIKQPEIVKIAPIIAKKPTCISNPNGGFKVEASGISKAKYDYYLYKESDYPSGSPLITAPAQDSIWENYSLPSGSYIINVRDNENPFCPGAVSSVQVQPITPLDLITDKVIKVKCFGGSTGEIDVSAAGGSEYYKFNIGSYFIATNTAKFTSIKALSYTVSVRNRDESCADMASKVITVETNPLLEINLTPKDANCFDNKDGQINTVVTGGSGSYSSYYWEQKVKENWTWYPASGASPTNLYAGEYRIKVTDSENCIAYDSAVVNQPVILSINSVLPHDVICYGTKGSIDITSEGGNGGYSYFYSANDGASYTGFTSGAEFAAGNYFLKVRDSKGCEAIWRDYGDENKVVITGPPTALNFSTVLSDFNGFSISGYGKSDGTITVNATGGNGVRGSGGDYDGYTYLLSGGNDQTNGVFPTLGARPYEIKVTDARGCYLTKSVTLTQPDILNLTASSIEPVKCFGAATGIITVSANGGVGPYTYQLNSSGFFPTPVFSGLIAGAYQVNVKDSNGNKKGLQVTVENKNEKISIILIPQDVLCYGESNGQIAATIAGGSGSYTNIWQKFVNGNWQTRASGVAVIDNLDPGKYRLITTDSDNCSAYDSSIISQPTLLYISDVVPHDIVCFGTTGSIDITATGGKGGYQYFYSVNEGASYTQFALGSPMSAASYKVKVTDLNSCETKWNSEVKITKPADALNFTTNLSDYNGLNISCYGRSDGSITINPFGGNGSGYNGYTYSFEGGASSQASVYSNLIAGSYNIKVTDSRGCSVTKPVTLTQPVIPVGISVSNHVDTKCFNDASGVITLSASGGAQPYEFMKGLGNYASSNEFAGLPTGNYLFSVRDKNGCTNEISSVITNIFPKPLITLLPGEISCYQKSDGSIQSSLTGGSGNFGLKWFMKAGNSWNYFKSDSSRIAQLSPGDYRIQVTDLAGCPAIYDSTAVIQRVTPLLINHLKLKDIICFGDSGSVDIQASGGNGGYIYEYSRNNDSYSNYSPGASLPFSEYRFRVRDAKGCETIWQENLVITQPAQPLDITWLAKDYAGYNVSCFGNNDGRMIVTPSGGNGTGYQGYSFLLPGRSAQRDTLFEKLYAGDYILKVTDGRGCTLAKPITLTQAVSELGLWPIGIKMATCIEGSDGRIFLAASGGSLPYSYSAGNESFVSESEFNNLKVNSYHFTVKDANGCTQIFDTSIINIVPEMDIAGRISDANCFGQNSGTISVSVSGGAKPFIYQWKDFPVTGPEIGNLFKGNYKLSVIDSAGCLADKEFEVKEPLQPLLITGVKLQDIVCYGDSGNIQIQASGSNGGYTYQYSKSNQPFENYTPGNPLPFGSYRIRVKDVKACETEWPEYVTITQPPRALGLTWKAKNYNGSNILCFGDSNGQLIVKPYGGNGEGYQGYSYLLSGRSIQTDTVFSDLKAGSYSVKITDGRGCPATLPISLYQPSAPVGLMISNLTDTKCFNDSTGTIKLTASGGIQPYEYLIGKESFVTSNEFKKLPTGNYHFMVRDKNGCLDSIRSGISNIYPKSSITLLPRDIRCYQKNDGQVQVSLSGGSGNFGLNWDKKSGNKWQYLRSDSSRITGLAPGDYRVQVTDLANCPSLYDSTTIYQKVTPLNVTATSQPACAQLPNGNILTVASGGTPPYLYGVDQLKMQADPSFQVYSGLHKIYTADAFSCRAETTSQVGVRNIMPLVNFMVASSRYELDTLVIKDVSVPSPERVSWVFSPEAIVISSNTLETKVKYGMAGIYPIKMIGYFGTCEYSLEKLINIAPFDPLVIPKDRFLKGIEKVQISPNPNNGQFKVRVKLYTKQQVQIKVLDYYSKIQYSARYPETIELEQDINIQGALPGTYILWVITDNDYKAILFIISQ